LWLLASVLVGGCVHATTADTAQREPARRVVALMPSIAEDLFAIGAGTQVVAVSSFTDLPAAKALPRVADFTSVDTERIVALHPDAVVGIPAQARLVEPLQRAGIAVTLLRDDTYDDIFANIQAIGAIAGRDAEAAALVARLQNETKRLNARARTFGRHPSVFVVLGSGPIWTAGSTSYIATLIALAGGTNAASDLHAAYGEYSAEALLRDQPDVLVTDPAIHLDAVLDREPWRTLRAVRESHVYTVNPASMIERPGPYYNDGLRWLIDRLTPLAARP
jgi:iron complex transport system substrate-binding protein